VRHEPRLVVSVRENPAAAKPERIATGRDVPSHGAMEYVRLRDFFDQKGTSPRDEHVCVADLHDFLVELTTDRKKVVA
jgi:hypothetical protein